MNMHKQFILDSPLGPLSVCSEQGAIVAIDYKHRRMPVSAWQDKLSKQLAHELAVYFKKPTHQFDVPLRLHGTAFQRRVWREMQRIPVGETRSYGEVAKRLNSSPRAVGNACRANPVPIIIPCHRIVSKSGLGGYGGQTAGRNVKIKQWLLQHEGVAFET